MWVCTQWVCIQKYLWSEKCIFLSICACKEVLNVSVCKGTAICEFPHRRFLYTCIHHHTIYEYLWIYAYIQRGSQCVPSCTSRGHRHMWVYTQWVWIQKVLWSETYIIICEYLHVHKEVLTVSARKGRDICELHTVLLYKSNCDLKNAYLWVFACTQRGSNCERLQGQRQKCKFAQHGFI